MTSLLDIITEVEPHRDQFDVFARGELTVAVKYRGKSILDPSLPEAVRAQIADDVRAGTLEGTRKVSSSLPEKYHPTIHYNEPRRLSLGYTDATGTHEIVNVSGWGGWVDVYPDQPEAKASIDFALLPPETEELERFRVENYLTEQLWIQKFPGVRIRESEANGKVRRMEEVLSPEAVKTYENWKKHAIARAERYEGNILDLAPFEYCRTKYGDRINFSELEKDVAYLLVEIHGTGGPVFEITGVEGMRMRPVRALMHNLLLRKYFFGLIAPIDTLLDGLKLEERGITVALKGTRGVPLDGPRLGLAMKYGLAPEPAFVITLEQTFSDYAQVDRFVEEANSQLSSGEHPLKEEFSNMAYKRIFPSPDIPENHVINKVSHRLSAETYKEGTAKLQTHLQA